MVIIPIFISFPDTLKKYRGGGFKDNTEQNGKIKEQVDDQLVRKFLTKPSKNNSFWGVNFMFMLPGKF